MIELEAGGGTFELCAGAKINIPYGGGIYNSGTTLRISGGEINVNRETYGVSSAGKVYMTGGTVNVNANNGSGIKVGGSGSSLEMSGGKVIASYSGSTGIYLQNGANAEVSGGTVEAGRAGGGSCYGVYVDNANTTLTVSGGEIKGIGAATAVSCFGNYGGTVNVTGGRLSADSRGSAVSVNNQGTANISGGMITTATGGIALKSLGRATSCIYITGGSIAGSTEGLSEATLKTAANGVPVYPVTLTGLPVSTAVTALSSPAGYGINGVSTDAEGKLYFYVPAGRTDFILTADSTSYAGRGYSQSGGSTLAITSGSTIVDTITVTAQPQDIAVAFGEGAPLSVTAAAENGGTVGYQWYSNTGNSNSGGSIISGATAATLTVPTSQAAGTYYYYCVLSAEGLANVTTDAVTVTIAKASYAGLTADTKNVKSGQTTSNIAYTLPTVPDGMSWGAVNTGGATALLAGTPTVSNGILSFAATSQVANTTATITVAIDGSTNYNDSSFTLTVTAVDKTEVTITGQPAQNSTYDGQRHAGYTGTAASGAYTGALVTTYAGRGNTSYPNSNTAPTNAGDYTVIIAVPADNPFLFPKVSEFFKYFASISPDST